MRTYRLVRRVIAHDGEATLTFDAELPVAPAAGDRVYAGGSHMVVRHREVAEGRPLVLVLVEPWRLSGGEPIERVRLSLIDLGWLPHIPVT